MELALVFSLLFSSATWSQSRATPRDLERASLTCPTVLAGRVLAPDGRPAQGAMVVTSAGGSAVTAIDGSFELEVELPFDVESVEVTATLDGGADANGFVASARVVPAALSATTSVGTLLLAPSPSCQPRWLPTFGAIPGLDGPVEAFAVFDDGSGPALYAGGDFAEAASVQARFLARWDGSRWSALASEPNGAVETLAVFDDGGGPALYAGGSFTSAGGVAANRIARWDGASWSALGAGLNGPVRSLLVFDDGNGSTLYVGGNFTSAGGATANAIARWDGASWSTLGTGFSGPGTGTSVEALAVYDDGEGPALYAGGIFTQSNGGAVFRIARWDGSTWWNVGGGILGAVFALAVFDDGGGQALYAGGSITSAGGVSVNHIAKWDGASWSPLGSGITGGSFPPVQALAVFDDGSGAALYAGGEFTHAGGLAASCIGRWNGASWSAVGNGTGGPEPAVHALVPFDDSHGAELYAGGTFMAAGGAARIRVARWDGADWSSVGRGQGFTDVDTASMSASPMVHALTVADEGSGPALYAGGRFFSAGSAQANAVARWNGERWSALGSGLTGGTAPIVYTLAWFDAGSGPALYAGGNFTTAGGVSASRIARWDGASWSALGTGVADANGPNVYALAVFDDGSGPALYVGGEFSSAGGVPANGIARWNGASWSALGSGMTGGDVYALAVFDDGSGPALYAGGAFTAAGGVPASGIARWNGASWSAPGGGIDGVGYVLALESFDDGSGPALYAGGAFTAVGGVPANGIARWDGSTWSALDGGIDGLGWLVELESFDAGSGPALYVGGYFASVGGVPASGIAKWDGSSWAPLASGVGYAARSFAVFDDGNGPALFVGGEFDESPAHDRYLAKWACTRVRRAGF